MCGIAVVWGRPDLTLAEVLLDRLRHRGPDEAGRVVIGPGVLAQARLAIVDLATGRQPILNERGDLAVVFNGEIYNHLELRRELAGRHEFRTCSDTEVLLHLYEEVGEDLLGRLDGMFALALAGPAGLLLARDPLGIKPLYYGRAGDLVLAASELKAFPPMDELRALPAGHFLFLPANSAPGRLPLPKPRAFACAAQVVPWLAPPPLPEIESGIRHRLERAVVKRLMSDVPVGVFLSGGLDSSLVAALMRPHVPRLLSFTAGMRGAPDLSAARAVAHLLGTEHHELIYDAAEVEAALPAVIRALESFDAPLVRSAVPNYFLARLAARHVKVVLTGEGADELFAGYSYLRPIASGGGLREELERITRDLQHTNLQRCDRLSMAWGLEARVPFLDLDLLRYVGRLPAGLLAPEPGGREKGLLRRACADLLPEAILQRAKLKFAEGAGSSELVATRLALVDPAVADELDEPFVQNLHSAEERVYHRIWRSQFGDQIPLELVGRTRDPRAALPAV
ncbi:MAG: asparagine synthase-related protein [Candidatus Delongbacteria bacterium]